MIKTINIKGTASRKLVNGVGIDNGRTRGVTASTAVGSGLRKRLGV